MAPGRHTTDAIWRVMVKQQLADISAKFLAWNWDLQKAFDCISSYNLWGTGVRYGYPLDILATSLTSYGWDRRFILNSEVSRPLKSHRGIVAGSPYAPYDLALHIGKLIGLVRAWQVGSNTYITVSVHLDDIAIMIQGVLNFDIVCAAKGLAEAMAHHVEGVLGMKLDFWDKAFLLSSHELILELARKALGRLAGATMDTVRKLGGDYSLSIRHGE